VSLGKKLGTDSIETRMLNVDVHPDVYGELELSRAW
jgi:toxin ParE1/3/4